MLEMASQEGLREHAKRFGLPFCEKRGAVVSTLFHKENDFGYFKGSGIPATELCNLTGYCYPCFAEGVHHQAKFCGRDPPPQNRIKCRQDLHNYAYYAETTDDFFLVGRVPHQVPKKVWKYLEKFVPKCEKGEPSMHIYV